MKEKRNKERRRITAGSVLVGILGRGSVPADLDIISEVRKETGSVLFDAKQLAWYKWKFRLGKLSGQDGKRHVIEQADKPKKEKKAKAPKKIVVKRKKK